MKVTVSIAKRLILLGMPLIVLIILPLAILISNNELIPVKTIVQKQQSNHDVLVGLAYSNPVVYYKRESVLEVRPKILVLGTSRVMQFRDYLFQDAFYNAGGGVSKIRHYKIFLESLKQKGYKPEVLIIGLDQYFFNKSWDDCSLDNYSETLDEDITIIDVLKSNWSDIYLEFFANNKILGFDSDMIGLNAKLLNNGFRSDGSYSYTSIIENPETSSDFNYKDTFKRIADGNRRFQYGDSVNEYALELLDSLLQFCAIEDVQVVGFLPPFATPVLDSMTSTERYAYLKDIPVLVDNIFKSYKHEFYDFTDLRSWNMENNTFIDGFHGSESTYLEMYYEMVLRSSVLTGVSSLKDVALYVEKKGTYTLY